MNGGARIFEIESWKGMRATDIVVKAEIFYFPPLQNVEPIAGSRSRIPEYRSNDPDPGILVGSGV